METFQKRTILNIIEDMSNDLCTLIEAVSFHLQTENIKEIGKVLWEFKDISISHLKDFLVLLQGCVS